MTALAAGPVQDALGDVARFVPRLIGFILILVVGWLVARLLRAGVSRLLRRVGFDQAVERGGVGRLLARTPYDARGLMTNLVYYAVLLFTLQLAFGLWGPNPVSDLIAAVVRWLPEAFIAIVIIVVAAAIAAGARNLINGALGGLSYGRLLAGVVSAFIIGIGVIAALNQIGVATSVTTPVLIAVLATIGGILVVGVGGGLVRPMQHRWESWLNRAEQEVPQVRDQLRVAAEQRQAEREEAERREAEERAEAERREAERREAEARAEAERRAAAERAEAERREAEARAEAERAEAERREAEARAEAERRAAAEREEAARREAEERAEAARQEAERAEAARQEAERAEAVRREAERAEAERREAERAEAERAEAERAEAERAEAERAEAARQEAERAEAARQEAAALAAPKKRTPRTARERAEQAAAERAAAEAGKLQVPPSDEPTVALSASRLWEIAPDAAAVVGDAGQDAEKTQPIQLPGASGDAQTPADDPESTQVLPPAGAAEPPVPPKSTTRRRGTTRKQQ
ncbi:mechanosensitive ion channel family protein [Planosporangium mesophilum]|uniref:Uncharacterized protein n=1 Tax=Planosporangium mesophilum TaxID=689768 RepID=A0A8J3T679_9ACTN|nr:hypothetical protein Pme01_05800 [Planosporangium mesophilum]